MKNIFQHKERLIQFIAHYLTQKQTELAKTSVWEKDVFEHLKTFTLSGKMIRGSLALFSIEMFGFEINNSALSLAAALEFTQTGLLIHDDIIDEDTLRRGKPAMHTQYAQRAKEKHLLKAEHIGESMALCVGDVSFFLAMELLQKLSVKKSTCDRIKMLYAQELQIVTLAEMKDITLAASKSAVTKDSILKLYKQKTGRYTFGLPLVCGALLAGNTTATPLLMQLGEQIGLLFQITDDTLSLFGNPKLIGKPISTDITRNNKTLYHYYLFTKAYPAEVKRLNTIFGNTSVAESEISYIKQLIQKYKIARSINDELKEIEKSCIQLINKLSVEHTFKKTLTELLQFSKSRNV